jgi:hypothetical protein
VIEQTDRLAYSSGHDAGPSFSPQTFDDAPADLIVAVRASYGNDRYARQGHPTAARGRIDAIMGCWICSSHGATLLSLTKRGESAIAWLGFSVGWPVPLFK